MLEKDIGTSKLKMDIVITRKSAKAPERKENGLPPSKMSESRSSREKRAPVRPSNPISNVTSPKSEVGDKSSISSEGYSMPDRRMNTLLNRPV